MKYKDLPSNVQKICDALVDGLIRILGGKLYGVYMYGAAVFPDSGPVTDIDCHVILREPLNDGDREGISRLYGELAEDYPLLGSELDAWYILLSDAREKSSPLNQLKPGMRDKSWALHCAHIRAGRYITLYGPELDNIFPIPSWEEPLRPLLKPQPIPNPRPNPRPQPLPLAHPRPLPKNLRLPI